MARKPYHTENLPTPKAQVREERPTSGKTSRVPRPSSLALSVSSASISPSPREYRRPYPTTGRHQPPSTRSPRSCPHPLTRTHTLARERDGRGGGTPTPSASLSSPAARRRLAAPACWGSLASPEAKRGGANRGGARIARGTQRGDVLGGIPSPIRVPGKVTAIASGRGVKRSEGGGSHPVACDTLSTSRDARERFGEDPVGSCPAFSCNVSPGLGRCGLRGGGSHGFGEVGGMAGTGVGLRQTPCLTTGTSPHPGPFQGPMRVRCGSGLCPRVAFCAVGGYRAVAP